LTEAAGETRAGPGVRRSGARWLVLLPSALLLLVAGRQIALTRSDGLSPWSGGGFGMFSTTDAGATRHLHAFALRPGLRRELDPARLDPDRLRRVLTLPSESNLRDVAEELASFPTPDHGPASGVAVQVWHTRFDPDTLAPDSRILAALELPLAGD
jgi:hypothetical protein